jgi:hypothetical protein
MPLKPPPSEPADYRRWKSRAAALLERSPAYVGTRGQPSCADGQTPESRGGTGTPAMVDVALLARAGAA